MPATIPPHERLLNLVVALVATEHGLTKESILAAVSGYREGVERGSSRDALDRMFERDKERLRAMGVPLETIGDGSDPDDLREARYRVPVAEYALPEDVRFDAGEVALLQLAASAWSHGSLSSDARQALRKVAALGAEVDAPVVGFAPRVSTHEPAFEALHDAVSRRRTVRFSYLRPGDPAPRARHVDPLALVEFQGRWHLFAADRDLDAERTFLLSRIVGDVDIERSGFETPDGDNAAERALAGLRAHEASHIARVRVRPGTEAALRLARRAAPVRAGGAPADTPDVLSVPFVDAEIFADEIASYGPEAAVLEPASLRDRVRARLEAVRDVHTREGAA